MGSPLHCKRSAWASDRLRTALFLVAVLFGLGTTNAQVATRYTWAQATGGTYTAQGAAGVNALFADTWDDNQTAVTLPFSFTYDGTAYTQITISSNGFFVFGNSLAANNSGEAFVSGTDASGLYLGGSAAEVGMAFFNADLAEQTFTTVTGRRTSGSTSITNVSSTTDLRVGMRLSGSGIPANAVIVSISGSTVVLSSAATSGTSTSTTLTPRSSVIGITTGSSPNRTYTIQLTRCARYQFDGLDDFSMQVRLTEGGGNAANQTISVLYGACSTSAANNNAPVQVGIRSTTSDFNSRTTTSNWSSTTAGAANTDRCRFRNTVAPASGLSYTWTPVFCSGTPTAGSISGTSPICSGTGTTLTLSGASSGAYGLSTAWSYGTTNGGPYPTSAGSGNSINTGNLTAARYYVATTTCSVGGGSATTAQFAVTVNPAPTANAGTDQSVCVSAPGVTLAANDPTVGTGTWSVVSGPSTSAAQFSSTTDHAAIFTAAGGAGTYTLRWTVANSPCVNATDDVVITVNALPSAANAGTDQSVCASPGTATMAATAPGTGTGAWSFVSGPATPGITTPSSRTSGITGMTTAGVYTFRWTVSNGACAVSTDDVTITSVATPTTANAGPDQDLCLSAVSTTLAANTPVNGTGAWSIVAGSPNTSTSQLSSTSAPDATFTPTAMGTYTLRWTISNGSCTSSTNDVVITVLPFALPVSQTFNSNGTFNVPAGVTQITVQAWGGGGAGGGSNNAGTFGARGGAGGGGGAYVSKVLTVTPGSDLSVVVGAAVAGTSAGNGANGNPSTITGFESQVYAAGGSGGGGSTGSGAPSGAAGGTTAASQGDTKVAGSNGGAGTTSGLGSSGAGGAGANSGGAGGAAIAALNTGGGNAGTAPGGGGGGGRTQGNGGNMAGGTGGAGRVIISYTPVPSISATATTICAGSSTTLTATGGGTYLWSPGGETTASITVSPAAAADYTVTVTSTCPAQLTQHIDVNDLPVVDAGNYGPLCSSDAPIALNGGSPVGGTFSGTGVSAGTFDPSVGTQTVLYGYTDGNGCSNSASTSITVTTATAYYADADGDGYGAGAPTYLCVDPMDGSVTDNTDNCPSLFGRIGDSCNDGNPFTTGDVITGACTCAGTPVPAHNWTLRIVTDGNGGETTYEIREAGSNYLLASGGPFPSNSTINTLVSIPDAGHFTLSVFDSGNNGIGNGGGYLLRDHNGNRVIDNLGNGAGFTSVSSAPDGFYSPVGSDKLRAIDCDNVERWPFEMIVCDPNPAVTAQWQVGSQTDDGYEFWFTDPNGSYSRRVFRNHATSGGYAPANPQRACKLGLASFTVHPLPQGALLNVRVRGVVNGVPQAWGPACRLKVDAAAANCHTTQLENVDPTTFSCGVMGLKTNGSSRIWAHPVTRYIQASNTYVNANRYKFHFVNVGENTVFDLVLNSYPMLIYPQMPFQLGSTYTVTVQASLDGGATYCPAGSSCQISFAATNTNMEEVEMAMANGDLLLWPNPNRGEEVFLNMSGLEKDIDQVVVDVTDMYGKRVMGRTLTVNNGDLNAVMDLGDGLANGLYLVNLTIGERVVTKRLTIQR